MWGSALSSKKSQEEVTPDRRSRAAATSTAAQSKNRDMGSALRSVYQSAVEESVPEDLLALLGKLD